MTTVAHAIKILNEALEADPEAMHALIEHRVFTESSELWSHPTIQVLVKRAPGHCAEGQLGVLGLLNGIFGKNEKGLGHIVAVFNGDGKLERFVTDAVSGE